MGKKDKDQGLVPERKLPSIPNLNISWKHPDLRLAQLIYRFSALGYSKTRVAAVIGMDVRTLEHYYGNVLNHGKELLATQLLERATEVALIEGDPKLLKYLLDKVSPFGDPRSKAAQESAAEEQAAAKEDGLNFKNLSVKELKELRRLMNKAKEPLDGKVE